MRFSSIKEWPRVRVCVSDARKLASLVAPPMHRYRAKGGRGYFDKFFGAGQFRQGLKQPFACRPEQPKAILCPPRIAKAPAILNSPDTPCKNFFVSIIPGGVISSAGQCRINNTTLPR